MTENPEDECMYSPEVDQKHLGPRQTEQGGLSLEILIFTSFTAVRTFDVHDDRRRVDRGR